MVNGNEKNQTASPDDVEYRAQKALKERPSFSIRSRLLLGFLLFFALNAATEVTSIITLNRLDNKTRFLVVADRYTNEIQQARRYEKNFLLYKSNLQFVFDHVNAAESLMESSHKELRAVLGQKNLETLKLHLQRYKELIERLNELSKNNDGDSSSEIVRIEKELREHGSQMISFAFELSKKERRTVATMFKYAQFVPFIFLSILLLLVFYTVNFLTRQIHRPLGRLMDLTTRIGEGDLTPIMPARKYRDEFTNVNLALNHMMHELKRRQEQMIESHKLRAIGTLTAGIAHELNNPLNNITLTAALLEEDYHDLSDEERLDMVKDLLKEAGRSEKIVKNLLDFARQSEIKTEHLEVPRLISETLGIVQNQLRLKGIRVETSFPDNMPHIHGDRQQLIQVFLNLILNSIDAMTKGGRLRIWTEFFTSPDFITIKFKDNGSGIPHHLLPSIFDPFFTTKTTGHGTGLGLSVSKGIIEEHGGDITVESEVGEGTTFSIHLPIAKIPAELKG
jgi:two-component system NtrC family sensor kinase